MLGDLLETKCVDPLHISQVVNYLLSGGRHHVVRDAALRAMMRLNANERHVLIDKLLTSMHRLPLQVLFTLAVIGLNRALSAAGCTPLSLPLVAVKLNGNRHVTGTLRGFDQFLNIVLDNTIEEVSTNERNNVGMVVSIGMILSFDCALDDCGALNQAWATCRMVCR